MDHDTIKNPFIDIIIFDLKKFIVSGSCFDKHRNPFFNYFFSIKRRLRKINYLFIYLFTFYQNYCFNL